MNAINEQVVTELEVAARAAGTDDRVKAVVVYGGDKLFGAGGTQRLSRLVGPARSKDIIFSGRFLDCNEALAIGLVDVVVPADQVYAKATEMAARYAKGPLVALRAAKIAINHGLETDIANGQLIERELF